jgi:hypothetical protein|tara:strand:+ start:1110 stop:1466 length:357 start_codon:yes stop_codon:yes gene_type:complete
MTGLLTSVGIPLAELFRNTSNILDKLAECQNRVNKNFNVVFYNDSYDDEMINELFKKHTDKISKLNMRVTKKLDDGCFFHINVRPVHRYGYDGDTIQGLDHFIKLLKHVDTRITEGYK